jgi:hypothetical protein
MTSATTYADWLKETESTYLYLSEYQKTYLAWLKDRKGHGEDGEASSPS